ncbi:MAG: AAA family ATPase [Anaerolineaceae bacterium]|nr:AAA family ATPase [Anaerolineaceae bacterium]
MSAGTLDLLSGLNEGQRAAVTAPDGPVLVLAGPGSGKTRVLTHRIAYLIRERGIHPSAIMAVTFTNKAAGEMKARVEKILDDKLKGLQVGTFHAICARLLRRESEHTPQRADFLIYDTDDQQSLINQALTELNLDSKKYKPRSLLNTISGAKNELIGPREFVGQGYLGEVTSRVYSRYQELLITNNARDFDDLLMDTAILFRDTAQVREKYQRFYEYLLVDEFQDTNAAQYVLVSLLAAPQNNVFVVGDEDQAIYAFRGADYRNVMQFRKDYPQAKVILLEQNYRSTQIILDAARGVIDQNTHRTPKALFTDRRGGSPITVFEAYSDQEEAEYVVSIVEQQRKRQGMDYRDFAIMYRTNAQSRALEEAFIKEGVPYKLVGGVGFYKRREIRDLLAYLRLVNNVDDSVSFNRIINVPKRGIGKKSVEDFQSWAAKQHFTFSQALEALSNGEVSSLGNSAIKKFIEFNNLLKAWQEIAQSNDLAALLDDIIAQTHYTLHLHETSDTTDEALERDENVREFRGLLKDKVGISLSEFLEEIALVADVDTLADDMNAVTLLTLHAAKGLEYPYVFLTGLEEGILPHMRSFDEPDGMAEERRLFYVGITRAMQRVYLTYAFRRMTYGESSPGVPSRFLRDIPAGLTEGMSARLTKDIDRRSYMEETTWDKPSLPIGSSTSRSLLSPPPTPKAPAPKDNLKYRTNQNVRHAKFGEGVVIESKRSGGDEEVTVSFKSVGIKRLAASFANLQILD